VQGIAQARELGLLIESSTTFHSYWVVAATTPFEGTEHMVEEAGGRYVKITRPPGFGLVPQVIRTEQVRADPTKPVEYRDTLEFFPATPIEYLTRWQKSNELFGDDVRLESVVRWADGQVSFVITQPQYHGRPAEPREIERYFREAGWERLLEPDGHWVFYHFAFGVIAVDAAPRNCYINDGGLQPFDVILCEPDDELSRHLGIG
jgi:hypothetical protein